MQAVPKPTYRDQRNINSGFDLAKSLAGAKNLAEATELQTAYWHKQAGSLTAQAEEVRTLSTQITADVAEPMAGDARHRLAPSPTYPRFQIMVEGGSLTAPNPSIRCIVKRGALHFIQLQ
jgi:Phasin protein